MNYKSLFLFALLFFLYLDIYSTHIRAGEIVARRISTTSLTYEFTVIGYTDTGSEVEFGGGEFSFGDGNFVEIRLAGVLLIWLTCVARLATNYAGI